MGLWYPFIDTLQTANLHARLVDLGASAIQVGVGFLFLVFFFFFWGGGGGGCGGGGGVAGGVDTLKFRGFGPWRAWDQSTNLL